jgi:hypothetical protein
MEHTQTINVVLQASALARYGRTLVRRLYLPMTGWGPEPQRHDGAVISAVPEWQGKTRRG